MVNNKSGRLVESDLVDGIQFKTRKSRKTIFRMCHLWKSGIKVRRNPSVCLGKACQQIGIAYAKSPKIEWCLVCSRSRQETNKPGEI